MRLAEISRPWLARTGAGLVLLVALVAALCAHLWGATAGARFATQAAGVLTGVFAVSLYWLVLKPTPDPGNPAPFANTRYRRLPTGSRIAYSEIDPPPDMAIKPDPVVYVHGGPGVRQFHFDQTIYGSLAKEGFKVFLYDQAGSGRPSRSLEKRSDARDSAVPEMQLRSLERRRGLLQNHAQSQDLLHPARGPLHPIRTGRCDAPDHDRFPARSAGCDPPGRR